MFEALKNALKLNSYTDGEEALSNTCPVAKFYFGFHEIIFHFISKMKNSSSNYTRTIFSKRARLPTLKSVKRKNIWRLIVIR